MDSLGDKLKESRENQNYTLDQVARDTRISKHYIEALEGEDFSQFPGETYLIGFLRNYAQYLGLDSNEFVGLYKNMKLQEQPIPMDELIHGKKRVSPLLIVFVICLVAGIAGTGIYFLYRLASPAASEEQAREEPRIVDKEEFIFAGESETRWFKTGDVIQVSLGDDLYRMEVTGIDDNVSLSVPGGMVRLELSEARFVDLNLDSRNDLKLVFNDIDQIQNEKRVNLWMIKTATLIMEERTEVAEIAEAPEAEAAEAGMEESETSVTVEEEDDRIIILESDNPYTFTIRISFRGNSMLRYLIDGENKDQRFFQKNETFTLDNVKQAVKFWISNAGVLEARVENREITLGRAGQVVTKLIRWVRNAENNRYSLEVISDY